MLSIWRPTFANRCPFTALTSDVLLVLSYMRMTFLSSKALSCEEISVGDSDRVLNVSLMSGNRCHTSHAVFFPMPLKEEVVSHPVKLWNRGRQVALSLPSVLAMP